MREIKFRAWDKGKKVMLRPFGLEDWTNYGQVVLGEMLLEYYPEYYELMQYTGLKDKNGKEIYEGDIVSDGFYVEWGEHSAGWVLRCTCHYPDGDFATLDSTDEVEVIGNIYENKELLK